MRGQIVINFEVDETTGKAAIKLNAPLDTQAHKDLTCKILAQSIPIAINYVETVIKPAGVGANGLPPIDPKLVK